MAVPELDKAPGEAAPAPPPDGEADARDPKDGATAEPEGQPGAEQDQERDDREKKERQERERAADRFRELTRDPLLDEQGDQDATDLAAASRARRSTRTHFDVARDLHSFDRTVFHSAHIGDVHLRLDAGRSATMRSGPVPDAELLRLRRGYVEPEGYVALRQALRLRRLMVLGAAPGTGRTCTALSLLDEVTRHQRDEGGAEPKGQRVLRVDPAGGVADLTETLSRDKSLRGGFLLEPRAEGRSELPPQELDLDALAAVLAERDSYAIVVVSVGTAASAPLSGRYGALCPPAPTEALLRARLGERIEERLAETGTEQGGEAADSAPSRDELLLRAERLVVEPEVRAAVGLDELRPAEAELLAGLLSEHLLGGLSHDELLAECRELAYRQVREWFADVDRALADGADRGQPSAATVLHPAAFRIALATLGGAAHSAVAAAAQLLTWELAVECDPDTTPARPLFRDDPVGDLALCRAELVDGRIETSGIAAPARLVRYRGAALPVAVLAQVWDRHFTARAPIVRWMRQLADDPRPQVWVRAAVTAGELCVRDFGHGYEELIRPMATATTNRRRLFAATVLDQAVGHDTHREVVRTLLRDWARSGSKALRWTAAMALGYGRGAATVGAALDGLAGIGVRGEGEQLPVASFNVVRLLVCGGDSGAVLRRMTEWTADRRAAYQDLGLLAAVRLAATAVAEVWDDETAPDLGPYQDWPLPLALAAARPELVAPLADVLWTALNTPRSQQAALDALESWLRGAAPGDGTEGTRPGLAALLPALVTEEHDKRRLDWLLRRMMNDPDDPIPDGRARTLWRMAVPGRGAETKGEAHGRQ